MSAKKNTAALNRTDDPSSASHGFPCPVGRVAAFRPRRGRAHVGEAGDRPMLDGLDPSDAVAARANGQRSRAHGGRVMRGFDMMMLTSDLSCMVAGARTSSRPRRPKVGHRHRRARRDYRRRSSVRGCSRDSASTGSGIAPGVWPNGKKRERRRASASFALTGKCS